MKLLICFIRSIRNYFTKMKYFWRDLDFFPSYSAEKCYSKLHYGLWFDGKFRQIDGIFVRKSKNKQNPLIWRKNFLFAVLYNATSAIWRKKSPIFTKSHQFDEKSINFYKKCAKLYSHGMCKSFFAKVFYEQHCMN